MNIVCGHFVVEWVAKQTGEFGNFGAAVGIGVMHDGKLIGGVVFNEYNGANINMHCAAIDKRWLNREALWFFFYYAFEQAKVKRVTALVGEGNEKSIKLIEGVGFTLEASLEDAHPTGKMLIYVMRKQDCKWLEWRHEKNSISGTEAARGSRPDGQPALEKLPLSAACA